MRSTAVLVRIHFINDNMIAYDICATASGAADFVRYALVPVVAIERWGGGEEGRGTIRLNTVTTNCY